MDMFEWSNQNRILQLRVLSDRATVLMSMHARSCFTRVCTCSVRGQLNANGMVSSHTFRCTRCLLGSMPRLALTDPEI